MSCLPPHKLQAHDATIEGGGSSGVGGGVFAGLPADPMAYRRQFRDKWGDFLHAHFQSHLHVALFFSVDERTSRNWWNYVTEPKGWAVNYARDTIPGAKQALRLAA
ncbi:hypothetical protein [Roseinatronobacter sp. NSM]|uniref:hypothetical protein n=1 Tax=Roseinatronobacter sp. NSM TaxID=3457785 RepID=UPI004036C888